MSGNGAASKKRKEKENSIASVNAEREVILTFHPRCVGRIGHPFGQGVLFSNGWMFLRENTAGETGSEGQKVKTSHTTSSNTLVEVKEHAEMCQIKDQHQVSYLSAEVPAVPTTATVGARGDSVRQRGQLIHPNIATNTEEE